MTLTQPIPLANGLIVEVCDLSRPVAADTYKAELLFRVLTRLRAEDFDRPDHYGRMRQLHGETLAYEHRLARSYVPSAKIAAVTQELLNAFKRDQLAYLGRPDFGRRLARARYREIAARFKDNDLLPGETRA